MYEPGTLSGYVRCWVVATFLRAYSQIDRGDTLWEFYYLPTVMWGAGFAAMCFPTRPWAILLALSMRVLVNFLQMAGGHQINNQMWCFQSDLALLIMLCLVLCDFRRPVRLSMVLTPLSSMEQLVTMQVAAGAIRWIWVICFFFAGFWKLNTAFGNWRYSCASHLLVPLVGSLLPHDYATPKALHMVARVAPALTLVVEHTTPVLLAAPGQHWHKWNISGILCTVYFHYFIGITPPPHNIAAFGGATLPRLWFLIPEATADAYLELTSGSALTVAAVVLAAASVQSRFHADYGNPGAMKMGFDIHMSFLCFLCILFARACWLERRRQRGIEVSHGTVGTVISQDLRSKTKWVATVTIVSCFVYAAIFPILGLQERGGCLMFSQLNYHSKSNHFLNIPTHLLSKWGVDGSPESPFAGKPVRILETSAAWLGKHNTSTILMPTVEKHLRDAGVTGRAQYVGFWFPIRDGGLDPAGNPFPVNSGFWSYLPYTISSYGLRYLLARGVGRGEEFDVRYERLPDIEADEHVRVHGKEGPTMTVSVRRVNMMTRAMKIVCIADSGEPCGSREQALLEPPSTWWSFMITFLLMPTPNPIFYDMPDAMHCTSHS